MTDEQSPDEVGCDDIEQVGNAELTRRQMLFRASVLGLSATAVGSVLASEAMAGPGVGGQGTGQVAPPGQVAFPDLGVPMPGDPRPDAPELAYRGFSHVGVRTLKVTNPDQLDILKYTATNTDPRYDRPLKLEVWYPAIIPGKRPELTTYSDVLGSGPNDPTRPNTPFTFAGRALRDARPDAHGGPYPLIIVSHGYPGSRVLLTNLTENLASKGYVVVAIDHTDSTHGDKAAFSSTMLNRTFDDLFVLNQMAAMGRAHSRSFLAGLVDADNTALVGYSMGGYGALTTAGAGITAGTVGWAAPGGKAAVLQAGNPQYEALRDQRIKALVPIAPWGGTSGVWDTDGLKGVTVPSLFIAGDRDQTATYPGVKFIFENLVNSDRYFLVFQSGDHEVPVNPAPPITFTRWREYVHYQEPALDNTRTNNVIQHFVTAFLGKALKGAATYGDYLDVNNVDSNVSNNYSVLPYGTVWKGFKPWSAVGLEMHHNHL